MLDKRMFSRTDICNFHEEKNISIKLLFQYYYMLENMITPKFTQKNPSKIFSLFVFVNTQKNDTTPNEDVMTSK